MSRRLHVRAYLKIGQLVDYRPKVRFASTARGPRANQLPVSTIKRATILPEPTYAPQAPSTEKLARGISNCADCATEKPDGPGVPITPTAPSVKLTERAEGCLRPRTITTTAASTSIRHAQATTSAARSLIRADARPSRRPSRTVAAVGAE